jgi:hypothetical protein
LQEAIELIAQVKAAPGRLSSRCSLLLNTKDVTVIVAFRKQFKEKVPASDNILSQ